MSSSDDSEIPTPRLPPELERYIFEMSALAYKSSIPSYLLVAQRVHIWLEPLLYDVLALDYSAQPQNERDPTPADLRTQGFLDAHVRHLSVSGAARLDQLLPLLAACTQITDLALWISSPTPALLPQLAALPLRRLVADLTGLFGGPLRVTFAHPLFGALTHLDVRGARFDDWRLHAGLAHVPHLTHLAFRDRFLPRVLRGALAHCARLQVLGVVWAARRSIGDVQEAEVVDARLFMVVCADPVAEWETSARGGVDCMWRRAEAFVKKKQAGEIKLSRLWLKQFKAPTVV
ncbi:hypothetical protein B0H10DRAFT_525622 [Mycena sp. CBHHK59/15]|nr:hypothetical protein B0H10DRAFT_525622 [Mycena sp. CBHHK59/15]